MTAKEAVEKLREYYYPQGYIAARHEAFFMNGKPCTDNSLILPARLAWTDVSGSDFETCFDVLDRLIAAGRVESGIPGDTAPEEEAA